MERNSPRGSGGVRSQCGSLRVSFLVSWEKTSKVRLRKIRKFSENNSGNGEWNLFEIKSIETTTTLICTCRLLWPTTVNLPKL